LSTSPHISRNVANLHLLPEEISEVGSQAIYGTPIKILKEQHNWFYVQTPDEYQGWVLKDFVIFKDCSYPTSNFAIVKSLWAHIQYVEDTTPHPPIITLPFETKVEIVSSKEEFCNRWIKIRLIDGEIGYAQTRDLDFDSRILSLDEMINFSKTFLNIPYYWGGNSSFGYDCSGFTQMLYRQMGVNIFKDSFNQAIDPKVRRSENFSDLQKGDLVFFGSNKISHVGMYLDSGKIIHAGTVNIQPKVQITEISPHTSIEGINMNNFVYRKKKKEKNMTTITRNLPPIPIISEKSSGEIIKGDFIGKWWNPIPKEIQELIVGKSFKEGTVKLEDLAYVQITHINIKGLILQGELVCHVKLAREFIEIFLELFEAQYPIEKVRLIDHYEANDDRSMEANCSSALCVRPITGCPNRFSKHSFGGAIDINPILNPYHKNGVVLPPRFRKIFK